jgi:hypothetical protein
MWQRQLTPDLSHFEVGGKRILQYLFGQTIPVHWQKLVSNYQELRFWNVQ